MSQGWQTQGEKLADAHRRHLGAKMRARARKFPCTVGDAGGKLRVFGRSVAGALDIAVAGSDKGGSYNGEIGIWNIPRIWAQLARLRLDG
jgi:hypothetical protein